MNKTLVLLRLHMSDLWGINRLRHSEDKRGRRRLIGMTVLAVILTPLFMLYIVGAAVGMAALGLAAYIPAVMALLSALLIVFTTFMKSSTLLFGGNDHDILDALPVSGRSILASRILTIYIHQLPFSMLMMLPALIVYAVFAQPSAIFYILMLPLSLILPLVPIVLASIVGVLLTWLGSHFRHKSFATAILSLLLFAALILGPVFLSYQAETIVEGGDLTALSETLAASLEGFLGIYPPAVWFSEALDGNVVSLACFLLANAAVFALFVVVLDRYGAPLRRAVTSKGYATRQVRASDFKSSSAFMALYKKELKRLFSSSLYLLNTATGGLLAILFSVLVFFIPVDSLFASFGAITGTSSAPITVIAALFLSFSFSLMSTTSATVSLEGRNVWLLQSLPLSTRTILNAKGAVDLTIKLPCVVVAASLITIGLKLDITAFLTFLVVPSVYSLFSSQVGLMMDVRKPNYAWTNEAQVVKQGMSVLFTMLIGMAAVALPALAVFALGTQYAAWILTLSCVLIAALTVLIYARLTKARI